MTLLVVDDQSRVVNGIINGVNWAADGFNAVHTAYNATEARRVLQQHKIDVMLCDIEMPVESGLSLVEWVCDEGMATKCIFLTSHMNFEYAQKALRLGSVDYLVLPAPYPDIRNAVQKAVRQIEPASEKNELSQYGLLLREHGDSLSESLLGSYLHTGDMNNLKNSQVLGHLPQSAAACHLALVQVLRQEGGIEQWNPQSLRYAISNIMSEIFAGYGQICVCTEDNNGHLCYLVYGEEFTIDFEGVVRQLEYLIQVSGQHLNCLLACYTSSAVPLVQIPALYQTLRQRLEDNVARRSRVFHTTCKSSASTKNMPNHTRFSRWRQELTAGYTASVRSEFIAFLDELAEKGELNLETLHMFFQEALQLFTYVAIEHNYPLRKLYDSHKTLEIYRNGNKSLEHLKEFIHLSLDGFDSLNNTRQESSFDIDQVIRYIHDRLEEDIRRTDLAGHFHLNPDYLARVFKKETGKTLKEFITCEKVTVAQSLLRTTNLPVGMIAAKVGYGSFSHFSKVYQKTTGLSPSEERSQAKREKNNNSCKSTKNKFTNN